MKYMLDAYKPDSSDYCMGCLMDTYESDHIVLGPLSENELIEEIARIEAVELRVNEEGYNINYSIYQPIMVVSYEKREIIDSKASLLGKEIKEKRKKEKSKLEWQKKKDALEKEKQKELAIFKKLKEKYEPAR